MKKLTVLTLALTLTFGVAACGSQGTKQTTQTAEEEVDQKTDSEKEIITLGYLPITHALAMFEAKELLDADSGADIEVQLQKFSSWPDLMDALNSGQIQGASVLVELAMNAVSNGIDLQAVELGHKDGNVVIVSESVSSVSDLKGKTFAIPSNQSSHNILLNDMLTQAGMTVSDINVVQLAPSEMPSSLASGAIDGYCVAEPFGAQAVVQGYGKVLYDSTELWENSICCALVFNGSYLNTNQSAVDSFIEVYEKAGNSLDENLAAEIATKYLGQDAEILDVSLEWIHYDDLKIQETDYKILSEKVKAYGINENPPTYEDFVYQK